MSDKTQINLNSYIQEILAMNSDLLNNLDSQKKSTKAFVKDEINKINQRLKDVGNSLDQLVEERDGLRLLADIEKSITSTLESEEVLKLVLDSIIQLTGADRCFLMLLDPDGEPDIEIARNWKRENISSREEKISSTIIQGVIDQRKPILTTNAQADPRFNTMTSVVGYHLRSIMCVPLMVQAEVLGVIYADHRFLTDQFNPFKLDILQKFGNQAAIALHNANLYENLQTSHDELENAYNTTLVGWAKALELRDQVTEGHTKRVTQLSLALAKSLELPDEELIQIERGAILHDIGKVGISDNILLKPGKLTDSEREIMMEHPALAMDMLANIDFLSDALDIPHYHHEKWDGTGYPDKLQGDSIPLAARIFAVVDVWDALTNDRPYRKAMSKSKVIKIIEADSGTHFDPMIVEHFIPLVNGKTKTAKPMEKEEAEEIIVQEKTKRSKKKG